MWVTPGDEGAAYQPEADPASLTHSDEHWEKLDSSGAPFSGRHHLPGSANSPKGKGEPKPAARSQQAALGQDVGCRTRTCLE